MSQASAAREYRDAIGQDIDLTFELSEFAEDEAEEGEVLCELCGFPPAGRPDCIRGAHARYLPPEQAEDTERWEREGLAEIHYTLFGEWEV
jgi:hypothetical protein